MGCRFRIMVSDSKAQWSARVLMLRRFACGTFYRQLLSVGVVEVEECTVHHDRAGVELRPSWVAVLHGRHVEGICQCQVTQVMTPRKTDDTYILD